VTAQDRIYTALRKCGQLRPGYMSNPELLSDALAEYNALYDSWNTERTMGYTIPDYIYSASTNTSLNGIYGQNVQWSIGPSFTVLGDTTTSSTTVAIANTNGLYIGQYITGTGIPANSYITALTVNTSITLSAAATASGTGVTLTIPPSFAGPRPEVILRMNLYMTSTSPTQPTRIPLTPISVEQFANISVLQITPVNVTTVFYYDPQFPQGVINVWPPLNGNSLEIFTWGFLTPPISLSTVVMEPPGYQDAITYALAARLWPMVTHNIAANKETHQWLLGQAKLARERVQFINAPRNTIRNDFQGGQSSRTTGVADWGLLLTGQPY
jgi:hypothetical protein